MIDLHCHILPSIDDGCRDIDASLALLRKAEAAGITDVVLTPHYIKQSQYRANNYIKQQILNVLEQGKQRSGINVNLYLGNEAYIDFAVAELLRDGEVATLAGSRYVLLELPVRVEDMSAQTTCFELVSMGYVPVIAHPERYEYFQNDLNKINDFLKIGCLMQCDYLSLLGKYGKHAQKTMRLMLLNNQVQLVGSDVHSASDEYYVAEIYKKLHSVLRDYSKVDTLLEHNPRKILLNQEVSM